jgi:hypothetical protein
MAVCAQAEDDALFQSVNALKKARLAHKPRVVSPSPLMSLAKIAIEHLGVPGEFDGLAREETKLVVARKFAEAARISEKLEAMLPKTFVPGYPLSLDYLIQWRAETGELKLYAADYAGATKAFTEALEMEAVPKPDQRSYLDGFGKAHAATGLARIFAINGDSKGALTLIRAAESFKPADCGNCNESNSARTHMLSAVWQWADKPYLTARAGLGKILAGKFTPMRMELGKGSEPNYVMAAKEEAAFLLGEMSFRSGDRLLAKRCFEALSVGADGVLRMISETRLRELQG